MATPPKLPPLDVGRAILDVMAVFPFPIDIRARTWLILPPTDGIQPSLIMKKTTPLILIAGGLLAWRLAAQNDTAVPAAGTGTGAAGTAASATNSASARGDGYFAEMLAGAWIYSTTNLAQTMFTETTYQTYGTFTLEGKYGVLAVAGSGDKAAGGTGTDQSVTRVIAGSGVWRIADGYLYTMVTNSTSLGKNEESRYEIMALNNRHFMYRNETGEIRTAQKKKP